MDDVFTKQIDSKWSPLRDVADEINVNCIGGNSTDGVFGPNNLCGIVLLDFRCPTGWELSGNQIQSGCDKHSNPYVREPSEFNWPTLKLKIDAGMRPKRRLTILPKQR